MVQLKTVIADFIIHHNASAPTRNTAYTQTIKCIGVTQYVYVNTQQYL